MAVCNPKSKYIIKPSWFMMVPNLSTSSLSKHHFHFARMDDMRFVSPSISPFPSFSIHFVLKDTPMPQKLFLTSPFKYTISSPSWHPPHAPTEGLSGIISEPPKMHSVEPTWRTKPTSQAKSAWDEKWVVWLLGKAGLSLGHLRCVFLAWRIQNKRLACESQEPRMVMNLWILDLPSFQWYFSAQPKASVQAQVFFTVGRSKAWTEWQEEDLSKSYMVRHIPKHHTISQNENLNSKIPLKTIERTYVKTPRVSNYRCCWILCH